MKKLTDAQIMVNHALLEALLSDYCEVVSKIENTSKKHIRDRVLLKCSKIVNKLNAKSNNQHP